MAQAVVDVIRSDTPRGGSMGRGEDRMSFELAMLAASCVLCLVQIVISSHAASLQRGYRWTASSRDVEAPPLTGVAGRLERALRNFLETFPVFVAAVLLVHVLDRAGQTAVERPTKLSEGHAEGFFAARRKNAYLHLSTGR